MRERNSDIYLQLAKSPRKSYLGKARRLTPPQERWKAVIILAMAAVVMVYGDL